MRTELESNNPSHNSITFSGKYDNVVNVVYGNQPNTPTRTTKKMEEKWNTLLKDLQKEYIN